MPRRKTSAAQVHAARINLEKARKAKKHKASQPRKPTSAEMTKWQNSKRTVQVPFSNAVAKVPAMRVGSKPVLFYPHKGVKYLDTKTINTFVDYLNKNKPVDPPHKRYIRKKQEFQRKRLARVKVQKVLIKKPSRNA